MSPLAADFDQLPLADPGAAVDAGTAAVAWQVEIDAPGPLRQLLERHLDLMRLARLESGDVDDLEWGRVIDASPVQVRELLQTEGYFEPQVRLEREVGRTVGQPDVVRVSVVPGPQVRIARVTLLAEGELERGVEAGEAHATSVMEAWRRDWPLPSGALFRNAAWNNAKGAALAQLRASGYALAQWAGTAAEVDVEAREVRLFLVLDSGPLFRFGSLEIEGLTRQDVATARNLAEIDPGTPVTEGLLLDYQERLQRAGLYESILVTLDPDPESAAESNINVRLREAPLQVYTFGLGVSANIGPRASVEHIHRRVFGQAVTARNRLEWGTRRQAWDGELSTHPGRGMYRNLLGGAVERIESSDDTVLSQRLRVGRTQDFQRIERLFFVEAERSTRSVAEAPRTDALAVSLNYHGVWRVLDNPILPTRGFTFSGQGGVGRSRGSDAPTGNFTRAYGRLTGYLPLGRNWYGQARIELGQIYAPSAIVIPESQLFRAGGDDSVRGYSFRSLGPEVGGATGGGRALATGSIELARPILARMPSLWGAVFVDAGNAANSFGEIEPVWGSGVGVRWRSPVGPLRLDVAWAHELKSVRLHFSVGIAF